MDDCNEAPWTKPHPMHYPITNEEMRKLLTDWPVKGEVVEQRRSYVASIGQDVISEIDEFGNVWDRMDCNNYPPKLPVSIRKLRAYFEDLLQELGFAPERVMDFERRYVSEEHIRVYGRKRLLMD
jgi:hypothetical protein